MSTLNRFDTTTINFAPVPIQTRSLVFPEKAGHKLVAYLEDKYFPLTAKVLSRKTSLELKVGSSSDEVHRVAFLDTEDTILSDKKLSPPSTHTTTEDSCNSEGRISQDFVDEFPPCTKAV